MSGSSAPSLPVRSERVRHQVRDRVVLMVFSAVSSCALVGVLSLVVHLGGN